MYTPNMHNVPMMKEKGEVRATVGVSNYYTAYAITDDMAVMVNGFYKRNEWSASLGGSNNQYNSTKFFGEAGAGYFKPIGDNMVFETYGGAGFGNASYDTDVLDNGVLKSSYNYSANTIRFFAQPSFSITTDYVDIGFSARLNALKFSNIDTLNYTYNDLVWEDINDLEQPLFLFLEPGVTFRAGYKWAKFHMQFIYVAKLNADPLNYAPVAFNFGVHLNLAGRYKD